MFDAILNMLVSGWLLNAQASQTPMPLVESVQAYPQWPTVTPVWAPQTVDIEPIISAESAVVVDQGSRTMLYQQDIDTVRSIASITKLMTALIFVEQGIDWEQQVTLVGSDMRPGASSEIGIGESTTARNLFAAMLIASSNESAVALARITGLSEADFITKMNDKAKTLGMNNTTFADMTGLNVGNLSTARDLAVLGQAVFAQPDIARVANKSEQVISVVSLGKTVDRKLKSTNLIIGDSFGDERAEAIVEAGKTGFIESAGYCMLSQIKGANDQRLTVVVLGSDTLTGRFVDTKNLAAWTLSTYQW